MEHRDYEKLARAAGWADFEDDEDKTLLVVAHKNGDVHFTGPEAWREAVAYDEAHPQEVAARRRVTEADGDDIKEPLPQWATGLANGKVQPGAQLRTRDGRMMGNAVVTGERVSRYGKEFWPICTDAGSTVFLTDREVDELFWPPEWIMDPVTAPGPSRNAAIEAERSSKA